MNAYLYAAFALLVTGMPAALAMAIRGGAYNRLVGLELASGVAAAVLILLGYGFDRPVYLIVPLVLVLLTVAGTLVYTRLIGGEQ
jgi:multisubunit Na+/H+ antiporter MnhF subunit